jgi:hypothetical protein
MAYGVSHIPQLLQSQAQKEVIANLLFDAASPSMLWARNAQTSVGLIWGYIGGRVYINGSPVVIANGTLTLTASQTVYVEVGITGSVTQNTIGFTADKAPLYKITTNATGVASYEDQRCANVLNRFFMARTSIAIAAGNVTLTQAQALCESIQLTGALTVARIITFPSVVRAYRISCNTTGAQVITLKTATGTGVNLADGQRRWVECDGINFYLFN